MDLQTADIDTAADRLTRPFVMEQVAVVDHFGVYLYLCTGAVARHRHPTQDELFYCHTGMLTLDTDWGTANLTRHEFAVVPRGVAHVSGAIMRTVVLFFQTRGDPDRRNGHGRTAVDEAPRPLPKWSVQVEARRASRPYLPRPLATVDDMSLRVFRAEGATPWHAHEGHDELVYVVEGHVELGTEVGPASLAAGHLAVVGAGRIHRLDAAEPSLVVTFVHGTVPPEEQAGG